MDCHTEPHRDRCALVSIDMQNDFVLPSGSAVTPGASAMVPDLVRLVRLFREKGLPVVHVVRLYEQDGSNADMCRMRRLARGESLLVPGTHGAALVDGLLPKGGRMDFRLLFEAGVQSVGDKECILYKPRWSAFFQTGLDAMLKGWKVDTVAVAGTWFPNCVRQTLYDASSLDYRTIAVHGCIAGMDARNAENLERIGCTVMEADDLFVED